MTMPTHTPLSSLSIDTKVNVRKTDRGPEPKFAASVRAKGIIEPFVVRRNGSLDRFTITDGGKRFDALVFLQNKGEKANGIAVTEAYPVPIVVRDEDDATAHETSFMANVVRSEMHPVDVMEGFAKLRADGMAVEEIAKRHVLERKEVEQFLALGGVLSPTIKKAWRDGKIDERAARAFTIDPDHKTQDHVFEKLKKRGNLQEWSIKSEMRGDQGVAHRLLPFVGKDQYTKAGGRVNEDLFAVHKNDATVVADIGLLKRLADRKLETECERLEKEEGWSWAEIDDNGTRYGMDQLQGKKFSAEQKKKAGCFVFLDHGGALKVERGFVRSKAKAAGQKAIATKTEKAEEKKKTPNAISNALQRRLQGQFYKAVQSALVAHPHKDDLSSTLAKIAAAQIDPSTQVYSGHTPRQIADKMATIANAIAPEVMGDALLKTFDAKDYFGGVSAALRLRALSEIGCEVKPKKAAEAVKLCTAEANKSGWLPPQLRTSHYDGPGPGAKAAAKKPAPKGKAAPRRKAA